MGGLSWKQWVIVIVVGLVAAVVGFTGLVSYNTWQIRAQTLENVVQLLNYNVQQGNLKVIPLPPAAAPAPAPSPEPTKP